jgi:DNA helicase-2/ATP-dependent DNA helicase PcrA
MIQNPSKYQQEIFKAVLTTNKNIVVKATAGAGKTSTIITASKLLSPAVEQVFLAFNKSIVETLKDRLPRNVVCKTAHSFGLSALSDYYRMSFTLNIFKSLQFIGEQLKTKSNLTEKQRNSLQFVMMDAIGIARMNVADYNIGEISSLCNYYDIDLNEEEVADVIEILYKIDFYNKSFSKNHNHIDFNEMIYLSLNPKVFFPRFDVVWIDEVQDLNKAQLYMIEKLVKPNGRIIAVGDGNQAIYGFAGAHGGAFDYFINRLNTIELPLSISYRCPKAVVRAAREIYDDIEAYESNPEGVVRNGSVDEIKVNDFVICRNNRPLIELYFQLIEQNTPVTIMGRDIEKGLMKLLSKVISYEKEEGLKKLEELLLKLKEELKAKGIKNVNNNKKYINQYEQNKVIEILSRKATHMSQVEDIIKDMFREDKENKRDCVKLMSIHRSKGLEADRVFMITHFEGKRLIPSPYAEQFHELVSEQNILFVGTTRAKEELIYIKL